MKIIKDSKSDKYKVTIYNIIDMVIIRVTLYIALYYNKDTLNAYICCWLRKHLKDVLVLSSKQDIIMLLKRKEILLENVS